MWFSSRLSAGNPERRLKAGEPKEGEAPAKLLAAFVSKADESTLGRILVESAILLPGHNQTDTTKTLRDAAHVYKVDVDAITAKVKQEFAAKVKAKSLKPARKPAAKTANKSAA